MARRTGGGKPGDCLGRPLRIGPKGRGASGGGQAEQRAFACLWSGMHGGISGGGMIDGWAWRTRAHMSEYAVLCWRFSCPDAGQSVC